ncbi:MAG: transglycosylase domain-containing protein [Thermomicrobiales bacterium]
MAQGRIGRSRRRYPEARRRMAHYGQTRFGQRSTKLPPHLLPSAGEERRNGDGTMTTTRRFLILGALVFLAVSAFGFTGFVIISAALGVTGTMAAYEEVNKDLPNAAQVAVGTFQTTRIYDRNGVLMQEVDNPDYGWRTYVSLDQISDNLINATVAAEDSTFWTNQGIEPFAILRGGFIIFSGSGSSGGSTITQQLVRSLYPEQIGNDYSLFRKGREALAAVALTRQYSKTDIMTMYLNQIYYGARAYGIEAASETFFKKNAADLSIAEASMLAGLPQAPSYYDPSDPEKFGQAKIRQQYVLDQMVKYRYITREEADAAWEVPLDPQADRSGAVQNAPHFTEWVRDFVIETFGEEALYSGLQITTSIDLNLQKEAEQLVVTGVANMAGFDRNNGAMVIMVPWSGQVLAMVGSADFNDPAINGQVNFATSLIQPGSSMKPLVYAAAFEKGWNPATIVMDIPTTWKVEGQEDYKPNNYSKSFYGAVTIRQALANSFNVTAVKAADFVGVPGVMDISSRMGIVDSLQEDPGFYGVSIGLGSAEVQLIEHTNAYSTLANNGKFVPAHPIIKIADGQGNSLYELNQESIEEDSSQAIPSGNAYQVTSIMTDNEARAQVFSTNNLFGNTQTQLGRPTAAKSGTTENWRDLWTMGYTTDVAIGVWMGKSGDGGTTDLPEIDGIQAAGPIWEQAMYLMHDTPEYEALLRGPDGNALSPDFPVPADVEQRTLCSATGHRPGNGEEVGEWVVDGQEPSLACGELSPEESAELDRALAEARRGSVNWANGAIASINEYAQAVNRQGTTNPDQDIEPADEDAQESESNPEESSEDDQLTPEDEQSQDEEQVIEPAD